MLKQKLQADQIVSMKAGDKKKLETLRFVIAQIKNKEIEKREDLTDEEVVNVLRKQIKELQESIDAFQKGGRTDLIQDAQEKKDLISSYLPKEMSDEELKKEIDRIVSENKVAFEKNPKTIIGICMKELRSKADPARIMKLIPQ